MGGHRGDDTGRWLLHDLFNQPAGVSLQRSTVRAAVDAHMMEMVALVFDLLGDDSAGDGLKVLDALILDP